jgi:putative salt-induced outer membrane protein YdiY
MFYRFIFTLLLSSFALAGFASDQYPWTGEVDFGYTANTGNTESSAGHAKLSTTQTREKWRYTLGFAATGKSEDKETTAEKYLLTTQVDYKIDQYKYYFSKFKYEDDRFSGFDYKSTLSGGYGRRLLNLASHQIDGEAGIGYQHNELDNGDSDQGGILAANIRYQWSISETASLNHETNLEIGNNTISRSITSLKAQLNHSLALRVAYIVEYTDDVPADSEHTDTETTISLVYSY